MTTKVSAGFIDDHKSAREK